MQKKIFFIYTLLTIAINGMEQKAPQLIPHIVYNLKNTPHELERKLTAKFGDKSKCPKKDDALSHTSPEVTRIHASDYLKNLEQYPSTMLAAINNTMRMSLYPNMYSKTYFPPMLDNVSTIFAATECVIGVEKLSQLRPNYAIALGEAYSFAGHSQGNKGDVYAPIPIAATYALEEHKDTVKRILLIDENITLNTMEYYFKDGNGSIFFPKNNPELSALFNKKIITHNQIPDELWDFLHDSNYKIDLAFYNINIDDIEPIQNMYPADAKERERNILALLYHFIPTIFILSGDKNSYQDATCSLIEYIAAKAEKFSSFKKDIDAQKEWANIQYDVKKAAENLMNYLEKHPLNYTVTDTNSLGINLEGSQSSSLNDHEKEADRLRKKIGISPLSSELDSDYNAQESLSTSIYDNINLSASCPGQIEHQNDTYEI